MASLNMAKGDGDGWGASADEYKSGVEKTSALGAQELVEWVDSISPLTRPDASAFDDGCGIGAVTGFIKAKNPDIPLLASDLSPGMVEAVKRLVQSRQWQNVDTRVLDAGSLDGIADESFTHALSTFMICFTPDPDAVAAELYRVTKPGGVVGIATWGDSHFSIGAAWEYATRKVKPGYVIPKVMSVPWSSALGVKRGLERAGFHSIEIRKKIYPWSWKSCGALMEYLLDGGHPVTKLLFDYFEMETDMSKDEVIPHWRHYWATKYGENKPFDHEVDAILVTAKRPLGGAQL